MLPLHEVIDLTEKRIVNLHAILRQTKGRKIGQVMMAIREAERTLYGCKEDMRRLSQ